MTGLTFVLDFLATRTNTKFLARPRLFVLNNETAELKLSSNEAIGSGTTTQGQGTVSTTTTSVERAETGVILSVTPQISMATGEITMTLQPTIKEAVLSTISIQNQLETKDVEERSVKSTIRVKDGETVIIGGLIRNKDILTKTRVPLLGEIPILGMFFRHKSTEGSKSREILVFITPKIIKSSLPSARGRSLSASGRFGERKQDEFIGHSAGLAQETKRNEIVSRALGMYESGTIAK
jgi:general secretion pathway protein D